MARRISGQFLLRWQFPLLPPGPQVWGERPRPAAVGRDAPQVGPKTREWRTTPAATKKRSATFPPGMVLALRPGLGSNSSQPRKAGWIPQGGGRPLLWRFFGGFLIAEKATQRSVPTQAGGHLQTNRRRTSPLEEKTIKAPEPLAKLRGF